MTNPAYVVATGARTALGMNAASCAAAVRAGISAAADHPFMINLAANPVVGALDSVLDPELMGARRLVALVESALMEASTPLAGIPLRLRVPVYLGLPSIRPGFAAIDIGAVRDGILQIDRLPFELSDTEMFCEGHAAGLAVIAMAARRIESGTLDICFAGGADSYFDPDTLDWLDESDQLAGTDSRSFFVPGEGAGLCLLASWPILQKLGLNPIARIRARAIGREPCLIKTSDICLGEGLTSVVRNASEQLGGQTGKINDVICDINGERYRSEEWGFVCLRLARYFDDPISYRSPADCWGDVGAASGPLFAMLACEAASRGYEKGPRTMAWGSSENGLRCAVIFDTGTGR
jgi:3-oxoacyl-[acyl-carrier-protein] synthase I